MNDYHQIKNAYLDNTKKHFIKENYTKFVIPDCCNASSSIMSSEKIAKNPACKAGYFCDNSTEGTKFVTRLCQPGSYCDEKGRHSCFIQSKSWTAKNGDGNYEGPFCPEIGTTRSEVLKANYGTWPTGRGTCQSDTILERCRARSINLRDRSSERKSMFRNYDSPNDLSTSNNSLWKGTGI